jgi:hypothetical protein
VSKCLFWLIGRGASIACNLGWTVRDEINDLDRDSQIKIIKEAIIKEMNSSHVDTTPYKDLLSILSSSTHPDWRHMFVTTNWDYLLQREILSLGLTEQPPWLSNSHVFHINGTVEVLDDNSQRSPFLLETDEPKMRMQTNEGNTAFTHMSWGQVFVVVGMSFECEMDKFLLTSLNKIEDDLPIGSSSWLIVNPNKEALSNSAQAIKSALPRADVYTINETFDNWVKNKLPELGKEGILAF